MTDVADNLQRVRDRLAAACAHSGRAAASVRLVAVSKRVPLDLVAAAVAHGQLDLGENRIQDALPRQVELAARLEPAAAAGLRWHFIGPLQANKVRKAVGRFALIHAVDSLPLARRIAEVALEQGLRQPVLLEINAAREPGKFGLDPDEAVTAAVVAAALPGLDVRGLMAMARQDAPPAELGATFGRVRRLAEAARAATGLALPDLSMGMSDDFEIAIAEGATLVRLGTAVFGERPPRG
ncbi:MAG: YggS family pyridoxal phosphate-dependent enzyme [Candidatus Latescibacteria bacterium]|nr:YggS family pyridoxal phosphate-dependent enzyme [Candidatus Latescibacterota bacterium]